MTAFSLIGPEVPCTTSIVARHLLRVTMRPCGPLSDGYASRPRRRARIWRWAGPVATQNPAASRLEFPPLEDKVEKWRREALALEARRARKRERSTAALNQRRAKDWEAWADARIAAALAEHDRIRIEATGIALAKICKQLPAVQRQFGKTPPRGRRLGREVCWPAVTSCPRFTLH